MSNALSSHVNTIDKVTQKMDELRRKLGVSAYDKVMVEIVFQKSPAAAAMLSWAIGMLNYAQVALK